MNNSVYVYEWLSYRQDGPGRRTQMLNIVAAFSEAEAARCAGVDSPAELTSFRRSSDVLQNETARAKPGAIFHGPLDRFGGYPQTYIAV